MQVEQIEVERLVPYARNARTHSDAQVAQIAASIREFGFCNPVLVDGQDGIIAGHGRVLAARQLGMAEVPCVRLGHLSDTQRRAYIIADNRLALSAGWDDALLALELSALRIDGFELELTGFEPGEIDALLDGVEPLGSMPNLPDGKKSPFQQMTFTLHDDQAANVQSALDVAKSQGQFVESPNENSNGNALHRICEAYLSAHA